MKAMYKITSVEQAKVFSHELRMRIIRLFGDEKPKTAKQIADLLEMSPSKVHYHVKELLRVGLLELVDTKEKGGIIEKYYLPVARMFNINLSHDNENREEDRGFILSDTFEEIKEGFISASGENESRLYFVHLDLNDEQREEFKEDLAALFNSWSEKIHEDVSDNNRNKHGVVLGIYKDKK